MKIARQLPGSYAKAYGQFWEDDQNRVSDEITSIQTGRLRLYAADQSAEVRDWSELFGQLEDALFAFQAICEKPKSHLRAVNEVRPIETVKRIGYESFPYLAAHSEDWLARTASGLKPARLFARVEDDEFQIYENRVVKTMIDLILGFLRRTWKQLNDQENQLRSIMDSGVQTGSFGFDVGFYRAVSELMSSDKKGDEYRAGCLARIEKLQARAKRLLKKYRSLRRTRLYRYLKKAKPVSNPLNETNILALDKHYSVAFRLWKPIHHVVAQGKLAYETTASPGDTYGSYVRFCAVLCGYAAHVLNFELEDDGSYMRAADHIKIKIETIGAEETGIQEAGAEQATEYIQVTLSDEERHQAELPAGMDVPIAPGDAYPDEGGFRYDGHLLSWPNDISDDLIDRFCGLFKTRESRGKEQSEEKRRYSALKSLITERQRSYPEAGKSSFRIIPAVVELGIENRRFYQELFERETEAIRQEHPGEEVVFALPLCNEQEQKITAYAREQGQAMSILPLTMFDINSFRRIQNVLYRHILTLNKGGCVNCGGSVRTHDNQSVCDACGQLTLTKTVCPSSQCRRKYFYLNFNTSEETIHKMQAVGRDDFFKWDSLYQYKDIVNMKVADGKIRTICPCCGQG